jgi:hypothetical protein
MENRFCGKDVKEVEDRFYKLLEEIDEASSNDNTSAKEMAEMYRELADAIEIIGDLEDNSEG